MSRKSNRLKRRIEIAESAARKAHDRSDALRRSHDKYQRHSLGQLETVRDWTDPATMRVQVSFSVDAMRHWRGSREHFMQTVALKLLDQMMENQQ